jgi:hypothetical protein
MPQSDAPPTQHRTPLQLSEGATAVGTEYELVTLFKGSESTMKCARRSSLCALRSHCPSSVACSLCCTGRAPRALQVQRGHLGSAQQGAPACAAAGPGRSCIACGASCEPRALCSAATQLVITGDSASVAATDTIVFSDAPNNQTAIEYTAGALSALLASLALRSLPSAARAPR